MENELRSKTCCFTGHRNLSLSEKRLIEQKLEQTVVCLIQRGVCYFGAGGARGFDTLAAQTVIKLRETYFHIRLILVLPCKSQIQGWSEDDVRTYKAIKAMADKVVYMSQEYSPGCMHKRNRHLVDHSGVCVCYLREGRGGTAYTVDYTRTQGLGIINLASF